MENGEEGEEVVEERKEYITNPDGTVTVKTIRTISSYVEEEEEEEVEENGEQQEEEMDGPPMPSFNDLSKEEMEDFMRFAAEKQMMEKMEAAGFVAPDLNGDDEKKKKKKRSDTDKKGKKKKKRGDGKENKVSSR